MTREEIAFEALQKIVALDFRKLPDGRNDFYSGAPRFIRAWLISFDALEQLKNAKLGPDGHRRQAWKHNPHSPAGR